MTHDNLELTGLLSFPECINLWKILDYYNMNIFLN